MDKGKNKNKKIIGGVVLAILLLIAGITVGMNWQNWFGDEPSQKAIVDLDTSAEDWKGKKEQPVNGNPGGGIAIPGFKSMTFVANEKQQGVNFYNPETNDCYFVLTLKLEDGTELWKSKMIAPGKGIYEITMNQTLKAGSYPNTILKYECFKQNDELTGLNGSEMKFELIVE